MFLLFYQMHKKLHLSLSFQSHISPSYKGRKLTNSTSNCLVQSFTYNPNIELGTVSLLESNERFLGKKIPTTTEEESKEGEDQHRRRSQHFQIPWVNSKPSRLFILWLQAYSDRGQQSNGETPIWVRFHFLYYPLPWPRLLPFLYSRRVKENKGSALVTQLVLSWRMHVLIIRMFFVHDLCFLFLWAFVACGSQVGWKTV